MTSRRLDRAIALLYEDNELDRPSEMEVDRRRWEPGLVRPDLRQVGGLGLW